MPQLTLATSYWPADTSEPVLETTVGGVLRAAAAQVPDQVALISGDPDPARRRQWRYGELLTEAERAARALRARFAPRPGRANGTRRWTGRPGWRRACSTGRRPARSKATSRTRPRTACTGWSRTSRPAAR